MSKRISRVRHVFLVPEEDLNVFLSATPTDRAAGIAIERLSAIASTPGRRSRRERALIEVYTDVANNGNGWHVWNAIRDYAQLLDQWRGEN
ncbi:hypothetical protein [Microbacterium sp. GXF6406]